MSIEEDLHRFAASLHSRRDAMRTIGSAAFLIAAPACGVDAQSQPVFTPEMFGARGDGVTDDYEALLRLAQAVNRARGGMVRFGAGRHYLIDRLQRLDARNRTSIEHIAYNGCRSLTIDLNGSTLSVKGDFHRPGDRRNGNASSVRAVLPFMFNSCSNLVVRNGSLNGNADKMTRDEKVAESAGHGLGINACMQVLLEDLHVHHFSNDGVRLGTSRDGRVCEDIRLNRVRLANNARQGLSNTGAINVVATDSHFIESGRTGGPYRHSPSSGVDVEPFGHTPKRSDFRAERCRFDGNYGYPVVVPNPDHSARIELIDCGSRNPAQKRMPLAAEQCIIRGGDWHNVQIACAYGINRRFDHDIAIDISGGTWTGDRPDWAPIYDASDKRPNVRIHGNRFELRSPQPFTTTYLFQCANPNHSFEGNQIFVARTGHSGSGDDLIGNFQNARLVRRNRWSTDASSGQQFVNNYTGAARVENERFSGNFAGRGMR